VDVAEFYQFVRDTLNRGNTLDNAIPHVIRMSIKEIENKRDFLQMHWWGEFTLTPSDNPVINLPDDLKRVNFLRYDIADSGNRPRWEYVRQVSPAETVSRVSDEPKFYWLQGRFQAVLDSKLSSKDRDFELSAFRYSTLPKEDEGSGRHHWLIDAIPGGLHARVMILMAGYMRDEDRHLLRNWTQIYNEAVRDLEIEDEEAKEANAPNEMIFWPEHIPYAAAFSDQRDG